MLTVSVVVCTRNRCDSLAQTLDSIANDASAAPAEVLVADNASSDRTGVVVTEAAAMSRRPLQVIWTPARGHARVRNEALRRVRSDICLFTDDDVTVEPGWIDAIAHAFTDPKVNAVAGRVLPRFKGADRPAWMADEDYFRPVTLWDNGPEPFEMFPGISRAHYPIGANMAFRMSTLPRDPFDPRFGHTGRAALGFDETELFDRLLRTHLVHYEPRAVVNHWIDATRLSFGAVRRKMFQFGVGAQRYLNADAALPPYSRRLAGTARSVRSAIAARRQTVRGGLDAANAAVELEAFKTVGMHVETLFASLPRLSEWVSTRV